MFGRQPGIVASEEPRDVVDGLLALMRGHRVWDRFPVTPELATSVSG